MPDTPRRWVILTAMAIEAQAIAQAMGLMLQRPDRATPLSSPLSMSRVTLQIIGIRASRLKPEHWREADAIILAGLAGGLDPELRVGDVVIDQPPDGPWPPLPYRRGVIHTTDSVITTAQGKAELFAQTAALAVDMEGAIVRKLCPLPILTIRSISDSADEAIPSEALGWVDDVGQPRSLATAAGLLRHPGLLPRLLQLQKHSRIALASMAAAVRLALQ